MYVGFGEPSVEVLLSFLFERIGSNFKASAHPGGETRGRKNGRDEGSGACQPFDAPPHRPLRATGNWLRWAAATKHMAIRDRHMFTFTEDSSRDSRAPFSLFHPPHSSALFTFLPQTRETL